MFSERNKIILLIVFLFLIFLYIDDKLPKIFEPYEKNPNFSNMDSIETKENTNEKSLFEDQNITFEDHEINKNDGINIKNKSYNNHWAEIVKNLEVDEKNLQVSHLQFVKETDKRGIRRRDNIKDLDTGKFITIGQKEIQTPTETWGFHRGNYAHKFPKLGKLQIGSNYISEYPYRPPITISYDEYEYEKNIIKENENDS